MVTSSEYGVRFDILTLYTVSLTTTQFVQKYTGHESMIITKYAYLADSFLRSLSTANDMLSRTYHKQISNYRLWSAFQ